MAQSDIYIRIGAKLDDLQRGLAKSTRQLQRFSRKAEQIGTDLTTRLSVPIVGVGVAAVNSFARFEKLENGLTALAGSSKEAAVQLERLQEIAQLPGISLEQAVNASAQLQTVGFEALQAEQALIQLSKAVTLSGKGPEELQGVVKQLTQINSKGRILQEDLGVILENVPSIGIALNDAFGTTNVEAIREMSGSTGEFTAKLIEAIANGEKFQNVQGGLSNDFDNFRQAVTKSLAVLGKTIAETIDLSGILQRLSGFIGRLTERFQNLSPATQKVVIGIAAFAAAIGPLAFGIGAAAKVFVTLRAATLLLTTPIIALGKALIGIVAANPIGAIVVAITALVAIFAKAYKSSTRFRATIDGLIGSAKVFAQKAAAFFILPFKVLKQALEGDFEGAKNSIKDVFGTKTGEEAAKAFTSAYAESIARTSANNISGPRGRLGATTQAELQAGREQDGGSVDFDSLFASASNIGSNGPVSQISAINDGLNEIKETRDRIEPLRLLPGNRLDILREGNEVIADLTKNSSELGLEWVKIDEGFSATTERLLERLEPIRNGFVSIAEGIAEMVEKGAVSFKSFAQVAIKAIGEVIRASIQLAVSNVIANSTSALATFLGPAAIPIAAAAGRLASGVFSSLVKNIPGLAQGGIIPPGYPNDTFPAMLSSGEAVIPLDKLANMMSGGGGQMVLRGEDLYLAYNRAQARQIRVR